MKILILLLLCSCTQKYQTYSLIDKENFNKEDRSTPVTPKLRRTVKEKKSYCEGQIFFSANAKAATDNYANQVVNYMCPQSKYLMDTKITETWWTTIVYSRSCVELEGYCTKKQN